MVKNIINIFIFFILCISNMGQVSHAFIGDEVWLNLYNTIDEWYEKIDLQNFEYELSWVDDTIKDKLNSLINQHYSLIGEELKDCIDWDLAPSHVIDIALWSYSMLAEKLWDNCKNSSGVYETKTLKTIQSIFRKHYESSKNIASEKSIQIQKIWSVWLYTDGILENSSFDLIDDIEKIDSIIFTQEIEYNWEEYEDFNKLFEDKQKEKKDIINNKVTDPAVISENNWESVATNLSNPSNTQSNNIDLNILSDFNPDNSYYWASSNYVCVDDKSDHWFNPELIDQLINTNENLSPDNNDFAQQNSNSWNSSNNWNNNNSPQTSNNSTENKKSESISGWYVELNDNAGWPCSDFFCITVDFVVNQQQLLGWWPNITIEYLIDRSNQHLRKFANSSLAPAKMTTQNFELWLKDLNLSEMFHMSFQVSTKPVPILDVNKNDRPKSNEYSSTTLLEKYYKANGLDYQRRNDVTIYTHKDDIYKTILNITNLNKKVLVDKKDTLEAYNKLMLTKSKLISTNIYKKVSYETLWDFGDQFTELNNFSTWIRDYTQSLSDIVAAMIKIPIDW